MVGPKHLVIGLYNDFQSQIAKKALDRKSKLAHGMQSSIQLGWL